MPPRRLLSIAAGIGLALQACAAAASVPAQPPTPAVAPRSTIIRLSGPGAALPVVEEIAEVYQRDHPELTFAFDEGTNSGGAIRGVVEGTLDVAVVNRPLEESEASAELAHVPVARDALVFAIHLPNAIEELSSAQVRGLYAGTISDWADLGGAPGPVVVLDRDEDESARKLGLIPLMGGQPVAARTTVLAKAGEMVAALESTPNAIGYSSLGLLRLRDSAQVRVLALDGVTPAAESVASGAYPPHLTIGIVTRADPREELTAFVDYVRGAGGRAILDGLGYAPPP